MPWLGWLSRTEDNSITVMHMATTLPAGNMLWGAIDAWIWQIAGETSNITPCKGLSPPARTGTRRAPEYDLTQVLHH